MSSFIPTDADADYLFGKVYDIGDNRLTDTMIGVYRIQHHNTGELFFNVCFCTRKFKTIDRYDTLGEAAEAYNHILKAMENSDTEGEREVKAQLQGENGKRIER